MTRDLQKIADEFRARARYEVYSDERRGAGSVQVTIRTGLKYAEAIELEKRLNDEETSRTPGATSWTRKLYALRLDPKTKGTT